MVKKARLKIVCISMIAMLFVTSALIFAINMADYVQNNRELNAVLEELITQQRNRDFLSNFGLRENKNRDAQTAGEEPRPEQEKGFDYHDRVSAIAQYSGRFAMATIDASKNVTIQSGRPDINNDVLNEALVLEILKKGKQSGYSSGYKYIVKKAGDEVYIGFLDCTTDIASRRTLLLISIAVAICGLILSFLFIYYLSGKAVWPLKESIVRQKRFITDAGHELKTPLQAISANLDILEMDLPNNEWIEGSRNQVGKMSKLVADLIALSRIEETDLKLSLSKMSASDAVKETVATYNAIAEIHDKHIQSDIENALIIDGDKDKIMQLLSILCDNAVKYAPVNGTIDVRLRSAGQNIVFETENQLPADGTKPDVEHLFDRFYRGDSARTSDGLTNGYGLGLSIAKAIANRHDGTLSAKINDIGNIVFTASFKRSYGYHGNPLDPS